MYNKWKIVRKTSVKNVSVTGLAGTSDGNFYSFTYFHSYNGEVCLYREYSSAKIEVVRINITTGASNTHIISNLPSHDYIYLNGMLGEYIFGYRYKSSTAYIYVYSVSDGTFTELGNHGSRPNLLLCSLDIENKSFQYINSYENTGSISKYTVFLDPFSYTVGNISLNFTYNYDTNYITTIGNEIFVETFESQLSSRVAVSNAAIDVLDASTFNKKRSINIGKIPYKTETLYKIANNYFVICRGVDYTESGSPWLIINLVTNWTATVDSALYLGTWESIFGVADNVVAFNRQVQLYDDVFWFPLTTTAVYSASQHHYNYYSVKVVPSVLVIRGGERV